MIQENHSEEKTKRMNQTIHIPLTETIYFDGNPGTLHKFEKI